MADRQFYPNIPSGDVRIIGPHGNVWKLNSHVLRNNSVEFSKLLDKHKASNVTSKMRAESNTIAWRFKLVLSTHDSRFINIVYTPQHKGKVTIDIDDKEGRPDNPAPKDYIKVYDNIFRCMYNLSPAFSRLEVDDGTALLGDCANLLRASERLKAIACVRRDVETALLRSGQMLWERVHSSTEAWIDIAIRLESPAIFRECMVRLCGLWEVPGAIDKALFANANFSERGSQIIEMVDRKVRENDAKKKEVEIQLLTHFPADMLHEFRHSEAEPTGRAEYANDMWKWQALMCVRQHLAKMLLADGRGRHEADGGYAFYNLIGGRTKHLEQAYVTTSDLTIWHNSFHMTYKGKKRVRVAVQDIKDEIATVVAPLLRNESLASEVTWNEPIKYLKFTRFEDSELPWYVKSEFEDPEPEPQEDPAYQLPGVRKPGGGDVFTDKKNDEGGLFTPEAQQMWMAEQRAAREQAARERKPAYKRTGKRSLPSMKFDFDRDLVIESPDSSRAGSPAGDGFGVADFDGGINFDTEVFGEVDAELDADAEAEAERDGSSELSDIASGQFSSPFKKRRQA